jgi:glutaredoxin-like protein
VSTVQSPVTVFWRPGCPWCVRLRRGLRRAGISVNEVNIWENSAAAAEVRSLTGGNETVPTVKVGEALMINPSVRRVINEISMQAPQLLTNAQSRASAGRHLGLSRIIHLDGRLRSSPGRPNR